MSLLQEWIGANLFVDPQGAVQLSHFVKLFRASLNNAGRIEWPAARVELELAQRIIIQRHNGRDTKFLAGHSTIDPAIEVARQEAARIEAERLEAERQEGERLEAERQEASRVEAERQADQREAERLAAEDAYIARWQAADAAKAAIGMNKVDLLHIKDVWAFMVYAPGQDLAFSEIAKMLNGLREKEGRPATLTAEDVRTILDATYYWPYVADDAFKDHAWRPQCLRANGSLKRWVEREDDSPWDVDRYRAVAEEIAQAPRAPGYDMNCNWRRLLNYRAERLAEIETG